MPAIPSPLYIISQGPGFTYVPLPWTCPPSHLSWGGGVRPWSIYSIDMTEYKLDPSHPLFATTHEILMDTRDTDMFLEDGDRYAVNRTMASLVVDSTGAFALSNASVVQMFDPHVCSNGTSSSFQDAFTHNPVLITFGFTIIAAFGLFIIWLGVKDCQSPKPAEEYALMPEGETVPMVKQEQERERAPQVELGLE